MNLCSIPKGYRAVPIDLDASLFSWPVSILVRDGGAKSCELVMLANPPDARAYLGCIVDDRSMVREWLQIWVQNLEDFAGLDSNNTSQSSSEQLDRQWRHYWQATRDASPTAMVLEPREEKLRPLYLDVSRWRVVTPRSPEGNEWALCRDDQKLSDAGLPRYSESTKRYLWAPGGPAEFGRFAEANGSGRTADTTKDSVATIGVEPSWLAINPQGAAMAVRIHAPLNFEDYAGLLGGATIGEITAGKRDFEAAQLVSSLTDQGQDGRIPSLLGRGNGAELFYLKLRLVLDAGHALRDYLRQNQRPLLNLDPNSLGVFPGASGELPWPWITSCLLVRPGQAVSYVIPGTTQTRFISLGESGLPAYCPSGLSKRSNLTVTIRPLRVSLDEEQRVSIEGKIWVAAPVPVAASDMVRFRLTQGQITGDFFGAVIVERTESRQEIEFRTWPRAMNTKEFTELKRCEAGKLELCWCELIPSLSSPYDMYSLSILGMRVLLSHLGNPLSVVVDEMERLGRTAGKHLQGNSSFQEAVSVVERLLGEGMGGGCLKAEHLLAGQLSRQASSEWMTPRLWAETLTILLRLMPGLGPLSECADYGAASDGGLHMPLEKPIAFLEQLTARARCMVFSDWSANREIRLALEDVFSDGL